jgi:ABC-type glycerol-3-phosphate transport system permease component
MSPGRKRSDSIGAGRHVPCTGRHLPTLGGLTKQLLMWAIVIVTLFPVYFTVSNAFKTRDQFMRDPLGLPPLSLSNFAQAIAGKPLVMWAGNSLMITAVSVVVVTVCGTLAAYSFAKMEFKGRTPLFNVIVPLMVIPPIVMILPQFEIMTAARLVDTPWSVIIVYVGLLLPFTVYLLRNFMVKIPREITDAALIDGCGQLQTLWHVVVPVTAPALVTTVVVNSLWVWNELLVAMVFLQSEKTRTLMVGIITFKERFTVNVPVVMAGLTVAMLPMLLLYILGQRYFTRGLIAGAVK